MEKVVIASLNPAKIRAVQGAFTDALPDRQFVFEGISVPSGVADQPMSSEETLQGAKNRVSNARASIEADFYVGVEAGIDGELTFAWMVIENGDRQSKSRSASLPLPPAALKGVHEGKELGDVMDAMFNETNVKQKGGAIGMLTGHRLTRSSVYHQALILALIPFMNPDLF